VDSGTTDDHTGPAVARGSESAAAFAGERATSLRAMFPAGTRGLNRTTAPSPAPAAAAPPEHTAAPARPRRRRRITAIVGGLVLSAAAGIVAVQSTGRQVEAPGQPVAEPPGPAIAAAPALAPATTGAPAASTKSAGSISRPASASVSRTAKRPAPVRSRTTVPATTAGAATLAGPISRYTACTNASAALFTVTFTEPFNWHHVFINSDANAATGYRVPGVRGGLGADLMVENDTLYRSTGRGWEWAPVDGESPLLSHARGTYRWRVPLAVVGMRDAALPVVFNASGTSDEASSPVLTSGRC